jgi:hypothetical protein
MAAGLGDAQREVPMRQVRTGAIIVLVGLLAACSRSKDEASPAPSTLKVYATILRGSVSSAQGGPAVKADGVNQVQIQVTGAAAPIRMSAGLGTFGGVRDVVVNEASATVVLTTCDSRSEPVCAGQEIVQVVDGAGVSGAVAIQFVSFETACKNGQDDNGDGRTDCLDSDCALQACAANGVSGTCQNLACVLPTCTPAGQETCTNTVDDDCDAKVDCADDGCDGQPCRTGSPDFACASGVCTDLSSGLGVTATVSRSRLPADDAATTAVVVTATSQGVARANTSVDLTTNLGTFVVGAGTTAATTVVTGADGKATATFRASATAGVATITAALTSDPQISQAVQVTMPALGSLQVGSAPNPLMGVKSSGWNEQSLISVKLLDDQQQPYPDGLAVRFEHQQLGSANTTSGSTISTPWEDDTATCVKTSGCLAYLAKTTSPAGSPDTGGDALVALRSGTAAGLVSVKVTATAGGVTRTNAIQNIAIIGAKPSGASIAIQCTPRNVPALASASCLRSFYAGQDGPIQCTAYFADRFNNVLGRSVLASFASEAGAAGPPVFTAQLDPAQSTNQTAKLGFASNSIAITGYALPSDVAPIGGEPSQDRVDACGPRTRNPRDGVSTVIVMARGEEGFVDTNGNGAWNTGEPFIDLGEPFVDANDDGTWSTGEYFVDANGSSSYDGPNGAWDDDATIWTETRVLYTGLPAVAEATPASIVAAPSSTRLVDFLFQDSNLNPLAPIATSYAASSVFASSTATLVRTPAELDDLGIAFTQRYCDRPAGAVGAVCSAACASAPCYAVSTVSGFSPGSQGTVAISSGSVAGSTDTVAVTPTLDGIAGMPVSIGVSVSGGVVAAPVALVLTPDRGRLPADGKAVTPIQISVTRDGVPAAGVDVALGTTTGAFVVGGSPALTTSVTTGLDGTAVVTFRSSSTAGTAVVTATATVAGQPQVTRSASIAMPALGSIEVASIQNPVMGVKHSGWNQQNQITVKLLDDQQQPYPDGLEVRFEHQQIGSVTPEGGSTISTPWATDTSDCVKTSGCLGFLGATASPAGASDPAGLASVNLYSGTAAGLVTVKVSATAGGATRTLTVQNIAIVGARASGTHLALSCTPKNVPALIADHTCVSTFYAGSKSPVRCTAYLADRFNNVLGRPALVTFASEAGAAGPPVTTAAYDPVQGGDQTAQLGFAANSIAVTGYALPVDVSPWAGEPTSSYADGCGIGARDHNPRDGLITVVATASGEEGFSDRNGNGQWEAGEPFLDQGEPFVDHDDSGQRDPGEPFIDTNGNNAYDGPNGAWDASTTIWTETRVLYTGLPSFRPGFSTVNPAAVTVLSSQTAVEATTETSTFTFVDGNLNPLSPSATHYEVVSETKASDGSVLFSPTTVDNLGMGFTLQYCDRPKGQIPTACSSVCVTAPCYAVPSIASFGGGDSGVVTITGGDAPGNDRIDVVPTVDGISVFPGLTVQVTVN